MGESEVKAWFAEQFEGCLTQKPGNWGATVTTPWPEGQEEGAEFLELVTGRAVRYKPN